MLCATINGPSFTQAQLQIQEALPYVDCIELCVHHLLSLSIEELRILMSMAKITILTLYLPEQWSIDDWIQKTIQLAELHPHFLTIDAKFPRSAYQILTQRFPNIKIIYAYHSNQHEDLVTRYQSLSSTPSDFYKIVLQPQNTIQALQHLIIKTKLPTNVSILGSGPFGGYSRVLSPIINNPMNYTYGQHAKQMIPGQLSLQDLLIYNYDHLSPESHIFALIGEHVDRSVSHLANNDLFRSLNLPCCHIKCFLQPHELKEFFYIAKHLPFKGLSVTAPFKQQTLRYVDHIDHSAQVCQATNTISFHNQETIAHNTDGEGLAKLLEYKQIPIQNKNIAILGAGGAAYAICHSLAHRGANLSIFNRSLDKAKHLADLYGGNALPLNSLNQQHTFDIIISCLTPGVSLPKTFAPIVVDINTLPQTSEYTNQAQQEGCLIIYGYEMFAEQAILQFHIWFPNLLSTSIEEDFRKKVKNIMYSF